MTDHDHNHDDQHQATGASCGGHGAAADVQAHVGSDEIAQCPVMPGSMVVKAQAEATGLVRDYQGQRYWLCCDACGPLFDADPERYAVTSA